MHPMDVKNARDRNAIATMFNHILSLHLNYKICFIVVTSLCSLITLLFLSQQSSLKRRQILLKNEKRARILHQILTLNDSSYFDEPENSKRESLEPKSVPEMVTEVAKGASSENYVSILEESCNFPQSKVENDSSEINNRHSVLLNAFSKISEEHQRSFFKEKIVHFDLKGAPPKIDYLIKIFPLLKESGATGILLEYEDMFPFKGSISGIRAKNSYCPEDIKKLLTAAKKFDLKVIPLIQTFGHLEFVLKLPQFSDLREVNYSSSALCPSNPNAFHLVTLMIDQVMSLHPNAKMLHIGCDEVFYMGLCKKCNKFQYQKDVLYLQHVAHIAQYVRRKYRAVPIIWDDMMRRTSSRILKQSRIGSLVEPMVWVYAEDVPSLFFPRMWQRYRMTFKNIWVASAFKGAFGRTLAVPDAYRHLRNHLSWLSVLTRPELQNINFRGLALTGWQRYEHFGPLCELFPVGLPSLILNLLTITSGEFSRETSKMIQNQLQCSNLPFAYIHVDPFANGLTGSCNFPGSKIFEFVQIFRKLNESLTTYIDYLCHSSKENASNFRFMQLRDFTKIKMCSFAIDYLKYSAVRVLTEVFDVLSTSEWIEQNLSPLLNRVKSLEINLLNNSTFKTLCEHSHRFQTQERVFPITSDVQVINQC